MSPNGSQHSATTKRRFRNEAMARVMKDLEAETGFGSYEAYVESLRADPIYQGPFWDDLWVEDNVKGNQFCSIVDVFMDESSVSKATPRCEHLSPLQTAENLLDPPKGVNAQIILWSYGRLFDYQGMDSELVDILGLGLNLDPRFFDSLQLLASRDIESVGDEKTYIMPRYLQMAGTVVAIARDCPFAKAGTPIILVAGSRGLRYQLDPRMLYHTLRQTPLPRARDERTEKLRGDHEAGTDAVVYAELLSVSMKQHPDITSSCEGLLFGSLLPLLQIDTMRMRTRCQKIRSWFGDLKQRRFPTMDAEFNLEWIQTLGAEEVPVQKEAPEKLYQYRGLLRFLIEKSKDTIEPLLGLIALEVSPDLTASPAYRRVAEEKDTLIKDALRLEAEIRDYLQIEAGQLSLLESRKSIEVSNNQLQESRRAKIVTILAFIYVPLNLATSIFGMNLQQLNQNGKSIQDFIITSAIAVIITGGSWWLTEQLSSLRAWKHRDPDSFKSPLTTMAYGLTRPNYSIMIRAAMIWWLVTKGHCSWMVNSGAGWYTITNSRAQFQPSDENLGLIGGSLCAGDFLSKYIRPDQLQHRLLFNLSRGSWKESGVEEAHPQPSAASLDANSHRNASLDSSRV